MDAKNTRPKTKEGIVNKFLSMTRMTSVGCIEFVGPKSPSGYGKIRFMGKHWRAHRLSYFLFKGEIPEDMIVCHSCDNPACVNVDHLWLGSHADNGRDKKIKGRARNQYTGPIGPR